MANTRRTNSDTQAEGVQMQSLTGKKPKVQKISISKFWLHHPAIGNYRPAGIDPIDKEPIIEIETPRMLIKIHKVKKGGESK